METNVDPAELLKFGELANRWWDPQGAMRPLHDINPLRLDWIDTLASLRGKQVLDVGCGGGVLSEAMALAGASVTGIDLSIKPLKVAELHALETGVQVRYLESSAENFAAANPAAFDIVTCMEMLEHVPAPAETVQACAKLVKPGSWVFFSTINRNLKAYGLAVIGAEYVLKILPKGTHDYAKFIKPSELSRYVRQAGMQVRELSGMNYNPFSKNASLQHSTHVNYLMACRREL